jgi:hypothetical protein
MPSEDYAADSLGNQRRTLGFLWIVYGIFRLILGIGLALWSGTATVMFGALLARVPDPFSMMSEFHLIYIGVIILSFLCGVLGVFAGLALLANGGSARMLAILAACFSVSEIPFGTTLGIYTLVAFLRTSRSS